MARAKAKAPAPVERRHLISLGVRCDVAFQLRMHSGDNTAHFFDWLAVPTRGMIEILRRDLRVFALDHLEYVADPVPGLVVDRVTGARFHHQFPHDGGRIAPEFHLGYETFVAKFRHLAQRFRDYVRTKPVTLVRREITADQAAELEAVFFEQYPGSDARFLYLNASGDLFETAHGHARHMGEWESVGDPAAWAELLLSEGLIDKPYRLSTLDIYGPRHEGFNFSVDNRFAIRHLETAMAVNPGNPGYAFEMARLQRGLGDWDAAREASETALRTDPDNPLFRMENLAARKAMGDIDGRAYAEAAMALIGDDDPADAALGAADTLLMIGDFAEAVTCYDAHLFNHPRDAGALLSKAGCLRKLRRYREAELAAAASLVIEPGQPKAHLVRSQALMRLQRHADAVAAAEAACVSGRSPPYRYNLAAAYEAAGEVGKAIAVYEEIEGVGTAVNGKAIERLAVLRPQLANLAPSVVVPGDTVVEAAPGTAPPNEPRKGGWFKGLLGAKS